MEYPMQKTAKKETSFAGASTSQHLQCFE